LDSSGVYRDLHSFPTRRSSDLQTHMDCRRFRGLPLYQSIGLSAFRERKVAPNPNTFTRRAADREPCRSTWTAPPPPSSAPPATPDRKSTRLNSSHVAISYAVFC